MEKWGLENAVIFIYFLKSLCVHACVDVCSYMHMCVFRCACPYVHMKEPDLGVQSSFVILHLTFLRQVVSKPEAHYFG